MILYKIECGMEGMLKIINIKAQVVIILDRFDSWKVFFSNPVHKFLWLSSLVQYILDFLIKKWTFGVFDCFLELFLISQASSQPEFL